MSRVIPKIASSQVPFTPEKPAKIWRVGALIDLSAYDGEDVEKVEVSKRGDQEKQSCPLSTKEMLCVYYHLPLQMIRCTNIEGRVNNVVAAAGLLEVLCTTYLGLLI